MAKYTRREFYELCGVSKAYLANYIKRGTVIIGEDGLIDDKNLYNKAFKDKRVGVPKVEEAPKPTPKPTLKPKKTTATRKRKAVPDSSPDRELEESNERWNLDREIKQAELRKKEEEIKKLQAQNAKLSGEQIPTELVKVVFSQHFKSVTTAFHQGADNFIATIAKQTDMTKAQSANLRSDLIAIVNQSVDEAIELSKESVDNIVNEYKMVRGKGERK